MARWLAVLAVVVLVGCKGEESRQAKIDRLTAKVESEKATLRALTGSPCIVYQQLEANAEETREEMRGLTYPGRKRRNCLNSTNSGSPNTLTLVNGARHKSTRKIR